MTLLIDQAYFRDECEISQAVDDDTLRPKLVKAHDQLSFQIGRPFFEELVSQFEGNSMTAANTAFYNPYVKQFLAYQAYEYYVIRANVNETRTGFRTQRSETSDSAPEKVLAEIIRGAKEQAIFYKGVMLNYLKEQQKISSAAFPLYSASCSTETFGSATQIYLGKKTEDVYRRIDKKVNNGY